MSDDALEGALVPAPQAAGVSWEDENAGEVVKVLVVVTRRDGSVKEYEAREPHDFQMNDPESLSAQVIRQTRLGIGGGGGFRGLSAGVPSLRLSFTANPRYNLHIRNSLSSGALETRS